MNIITATVKYVANKKIRVSKEDLDQEYSMQKSKISIENIATKSINFLPQPSNSNIKNPQTHFD